MREFPHTYAISARARTEGDVTLEGERLPALLSAAPAEFGGPGDQWSPETLVVAAVADCFVLTFRAIAALSNLAWVSITCHVSGTLDRMNRTTQFTAFAVHATLEIPEDVNGEQAARLLARAEQNCLITNSLKAECQFGSDIRVVRRAAA